jgi:hypothetical protein
LGADLHPMESSPGDEFDLASWAKSFTAAATVKMMELCYLSKPVTGRIIRFSLQKRKIHSNTQPSSVENE